MPFLNILNITFHLPRLSQKGPVPYGTQFSSSYNASLRGTHEENALGSTKHERPEFK